MWAREDKVEALPQHVALEQGVVMVGCSIKQEKDVVLAPLRLADDLLLEVVHEEDHHLVVRGSEGEAVEDSSIGSEGGNHA